MTKLERMKMIIVISVEIIILSGIIGIMVVLLDKLRWS